MALDTAKDFYNDLPGLLRRRDLVASLDPAGPPTAVLLDEPTGGPPASMIVVAGSFNPPTRAHVALAEAARRQTNTPVVHFLLSKATVDKERPTGASMDDRVAVVQSFAEANRGFGTILANRGLYVEEAIALRTRFPGLRELCFVVGFDKILQVFDPRYYQDPAAALGELFALATFLVAPRPVTAQAGNDLAGVLARPENAAFRSKVSPLPMPARLAGLSSSLVRERIAAGFRVRRLVPPQVIEFIAASGAYLAPARLGAGEEIDRYAIRRALVDALDHDRIRTAEQPDLPNLLRLAWSDSPRGRQLRAILQKHGRGAIEEFTGK